MTIVTVASEQPSMSNQNQPIRAQISQNGPIRAREKMDQGALSWVVSYGQWFSVGRLTDEEGGGAEMGSLHGGVLGWIEGEGKRGGTC